MYRMKHRPLQMKPPRHLARGLAVGALVASWAALSACGVLLLPDPAQDGQVDVRSRMVTKESNAIRISVQSMAWRFDPYYLDDYFTPLFVLIRNGTDEPVTVAFEDFVLLDNQGNQFSVVPPQMVDRAMIGRGAPYPYARPRHPFPPMILGPYDRGAFAYRYADIMLLGLAETKILPHAQVRGFLYFQRATFEGQRLVLTSSVGGQQQEFHFTLQP